jgi:hypothetical protein
MRDSSSERQFTSNVSESEFKPTPTQNWSPSVLSATKYFGGKEVTAAALASRILVNHSSYSRGRAKEFAARLDEAS